MRCKAGGCSRNGAQHLHRRYVGDATPVRSFAAGSGTINATAGGVGNVYTIGQAGGILYVTDNVGGDSNAQVKIFSPAFSLTPTSPTFFTDLPDARYGTVTPSGVLYVYSMNYGGHNVTEYSSAGSLIATYPMAGGGYGIAFDPSGYMFLADNNAHVVEVYRRPSPVLLATIQTGVASGPNAVNFGR